MQGIDFPVVVSDSHSKAVIERCKLLNCLTAVVSMMNSTVDVTDCEFVVDFVLMLSTNIEGKVRFRRNSVKPRDSSFAAVGFV